MSPKNPIKTPSIITIKGYRRKSKESTKSSKTNIDITPIETNNIVESCVLPTPVYFDTFVPWMALQWKLPVRIYVYRMNIVSEAVKLRGKISTDGQNISRTESVLRDFVDDPVLRIKAYYDTTNNLQEVAILPSIYKVPSRVIRIINICLPFNLKFYRFILNGAKIDYIVLYEISNLLTYSNITEVYLDNTNIPEGNYYVLLEQKSQLKVLSLCKCKINSKVCENIASKLAFGCPAEKTLAVLNLASNNIGNKGARSLAICLRSNRNLLHLNISDNNISDEGVMYIFEHMMEFPLVYEEIIAKKWRRYRWLEKRQEIFKKCLADVVVLAKPEELIQTPKTKISQKSVKLTSSAKKSSTRSINTVIANNVRKSVNDVSIATNMCNQIIGEIIEPFSDRNTMKKNGWFYCKGNSTLCSLNLAFNDLEFQSVKKLNEVLKYQSEKYDENPSLLRVVLDGNMIPIRCLELDEINTLLENARNGNRKLLSRSTLGYIKKH